MGAHDIAISLNELERGLPTTEKDGEYKTTITVPPSEYHNQYVTPKLKHKPWLGILNEFLDPEEKSFSVPLHHRMSAFNIDVIHISKSGEVDVPVKCKDAVEFKQAISKTDKEQGGTLIIAEDLSREMIDALGIQYNLEPEFFACHLLGTESFRTGTWESPLVRRPPRAPNVLPNYIRKAPFYTVELRRPYHFLGGFREIVNTRSKETCTPRGALMLKHTMNDAFVFEKISVYKRENSNFGVILTDKLLSKDLPSSYMLDIIDNNSDTVGSSGRGSQISSQEELVTWFQRMTPQDAKAVFDGPEPLALRPVLQIVEKTCATFLALARYFISRIAYGHFDEQLPDSIPFTLHVSRTLYINIHDHQKILGLAMRLASLKGGEAFAEQVQDLQFIADDMGGVLKALDADVRFLASAASISEGKIVGWISKFALLFLPVSLLATILTISDDYVRFAILGGLSLPFVLITVYFTFFWKPSDIDSLKSYTPKNS